MELGSVVATAVNAGPMEIVNTFLRFPAWNTLRSSSGHFPHFHVGNSFLASKLKC